MRPQPFRRPARLRALDRGHGARRVTWLELFFDLVFVAAVAQVGTPLAMDFSPAGLVRFAALFVLIWWAWVGHTTFSTRFDTDDVVQRGFTLVQMFAVAVMAVNAKEAIDSRSSAGFAAAYAVMRFVLVLQYLRARHIEASRPLTDRYLAGCSVAAVLWIAAALSPPPARYWLWGLALAIDLATPLVAEAHSVDAPPDPSHLPERFGLFTIILLGESMVAVMKGMESQEDWSVPAATAAFVGLTLTFLLWWWYFDGAAGAAERPTRTRRDARLLRLWSYAHLPMFLGVAVTGVGLEHVLHAAPSGHPGAHELEVLCGALALAMLAVTVIGASSPEALAAPGWRARFGSHLVLTAIAAVTGTVATAIPPHLVVVWLASIAGAQVAVALRHRAARTEAIEVAPAFDSVSGAGVPPANL